MNIIEFFIAFSLFFFATLIVYIITNYNHCNEHFYNFPDPIGTLTQSEKNQSLYSPIIIRPREINAQVYKGKCTNPLYPMASKDGKGEMGFPNSKIEASFYAQRPLLNPDQYYKMIEQLFTTMRKYKQLPKKINESLFIYPDQFSQGDTFSNVMKFIMKLINKSKKETKAMVEYANIDTWGGEQFAFTDQKVFSFARYKQNGTEMEQAREAKMNEPKRLIVNFNLYNTLRNISTDVLASVFYIDGKYYFQDIHMTTKKDTNFIKGHNLDNGINLNYSDSRQPVPQWIFANTIENQTFNNKGFHDPNDQNIYIKGGIPDEYKSFINNKDFIYSYWTKYYNAQNLPGGPLLPNTSTSKLNSQILI
jgi:hypothetical protein